MSMIDEAILSKINDKIIGDNIKNGEKGGMLISKEILDDLKEDTEVIGGIASMFAYGAPKGLATSVEITEATSDAGKDCYQLMVKF